MFFPSTSGSVKAPAWKAPAKKSSGWTAVPLRCGTRRFHQEMGGFSMAKKLVKPRNLW